MVTLEVAQFASNVKNSKLFNSIVVATILISALIDGLQSFDFKDRYFSIINLVDNVVIAWFLIEMVIRIASFDNKFDFFKVPLNCLDFLIVGICVIPVNGIDNLLLFRLLRLFRVLRLFVILPELRVLLNSLLRSIPQLTYVGIMMFVIFYVYASLGSFLFAEINHELWGNIGTSMLTLFRVMTFEDWTDVMYEAMHVYQYSWAYFVSFIFLTAFAFLNMVIAILSNGLAMEVESNSEQDIEELKSELAEVKVLVKSLHEQNKNVTIQLTDRK